ncbi:NAD-dependent protein deacetylase [Nymphon striatum]|nr:NAD-dependent protein deacetylase [Nymphon striatum]
MPQKPQSNKNSNADSLLSALKNKRKIWILSGAGISAPSGIPTYRDHKGKWQASNPIQHNEFINEESFRKRYWARSMAGWIITGHAQPNAAHQAITQLQQHGLLSKIVTQNVDRLHSNAGAKEVIDLHGRIDQIICLNSVKHCQMVMQILMTTIQTLSTSHLVKSCGGTLMPDVVFFGGVVPKARVDEAFDSLADADCVLVVGSSLKVYSGFRFPRWAHQNNLPLYAINQGEMRGEDMFDLVVPESCEEILPQLVNQLT